MNIYQVVTTTPIVSEQVTVVVSDLGLADPVTSAHSQHHHVATMVGYGGGEQDDDDDGGDDDHNEPDLTHFTMVSPPGDGNEYQSEQKLSSVCRKVLINCIYLFICCICTCCIRYIFYSCLYYNIRCLSQVE
jgi:hypothetical protein